MLFAGRNREISRGSSKKNNFLSQLDHVHILRDFIYYPFVIVCDYVPGYKLFVSNKSRSLIGCIFRSIRYQFENSNVLSNNIWAV